MTIVAIDLSSIARPIFEAASDVLSVHTSIVQRVRELASAHPHCAICCDAGRSFRKDLDPTYKANRPETPAAYGHQLKLAIEILQADGFPIFAVPGYEGDDLIASVCAKMQGLHASTDGALMDVLVISADKDLLQLISERVQQFRPGIGTAPPKTYDVAAVIEKFDIRPDQMLDYLALVGDTSDNIVGAKKIGAVTAAKLLNTFGNLDDLYSAMDNGGIAVTPAIMASLLEFRARMPLVRSLLALKTDAPISFEDVFKPRVPLDVETFGDDIDFGMPTLEEPVNERSDSIEDLSDAAAYATATPHRPPRDLAEAPVAPSVQSPGTSVCNPPARSGGDSGQFDPPIQPVLADRMSPGPWIPMPKPVAPGFGRIATALARAQGQIVGASKDSNNPFFSTKYADLASVWAACRGPLSANEIAVVQVPATKFIGTPQFEVKPSPRGERVVVKVISSVRVTTMLLHSSGESLESSVETLLPTGDPQSIGSAITYLRRYALAAMVGVAPEDDDGEAATRIAPTVDQRYAQQQADAKRAKQ